MAIQIQYRRGLASEWTVANPVLADGEPGYESDTGKFKVGNGVDTWSNLAYSSGPIGLQGPQGIQGIQGLTGDRGPAGIQWVGEWSEYAAYVTHDGVIYAGSSWVCLQDHSGQAPAEGAYWQLFAEKGSDSNAITVGGVTPTAVGLGLLGAVDEEAQRTALGLSDAATRTIGAAFGVAGLDANGKVPVTQLPSSIMEYKGLWNASTNTPSLTDGVGDNGDVYRVSAPGTHDFGDGSVSFETGDLVIYNGAQWEKSDTTDAVSSVDGMSGNVDLSERYISLVDRPTGDIVGTSDTQTLTNKRINARVSVTASSPTPTPNADTDDMYVLTALAEAAVFGEPTGTPTEGQPLILRIKDNGTPRAVSWNAAYRPIGTPLPAATVVNKTMYLGFKRNSIDSKWDLIASAQEA